MEIDLETLIISVDRPSRVKTLEDGDTIDTGEADGSGTINVTAVVANIITARSVCFVGVGIEVGGDRMNWSEESIVEEAAQMLVRDYIEAQPLPMSMRLSSHTSEDEDEPILVGHIAG